MLCAKCQAEECCIARLNICGCPGGVWTLLEQSIGWGSQSWLQPAFSQAFSRLSNLYIFRAEKLSWWDRRFRLSLELGHFPWVML
jgi:hypothetical protein